ncbi:hypothetical protein OG762_32875 [Streptomyces sp. NBC_01136]|uniref:hypothetical protein n=1 Tax=unclassified Streptomyces TaxID=2593676 RepID=UPI0032533380|nr:hypothetical protein OG762_32875 [Streptomyces sp. NBC_01136]
MTGQATPPGDVPAEEFGFNFRSGRLCLAFVATVGERSGGATSNGCENLPTWRAGTGYVSAGAAAAY